MAGSIAKPTIEQNRLSEAPHYGIDTKELRLVMIGMTRVGKSATGNTILNGNYFHSQASLESVTDKCHFNTKEVSDRNVLVVDTPGFLDTSMDKETVEKEIKKCIGLSSPGPHAFLLVTSVTNRFTEQVATVFNEIDAMFGENLKRYLIVIFTGKDCLHGRPIEEFTANAPAKMKQILQSAAGGYLAFNNAGTEKEKEEDVKTLLSRVEEMKVQNEESHFTSAMFEEAERIMRVRIEEKLKEEKRRKKIQRDIEQTQKRLKMERDFYMKLQEQSEAKRIEMKKQFEAAKRKEEERIFYSAKETELGELVRREMEKIQIKKELTERRKDQKGKERSHSKLQLIQVEKELKEIAAEKKRIEEEITDEILSKSARMEERNNIANDSVSSSVSFFERVVAVWVCGKCFEKNLPCDQHCKNCGEVTVQRNRSRTSVFQGSHCNEQKSSSELEELRIVLLGKTGAGKSATANTFLNQKLFRSVSSLTSVTKKCQYYQRERWGRNILIVDTPGLFDTEMSKEVIGTEIKKSIAIASPGPHAFLLVISLSTRFTKEETDVIKELDEMFGPGMMKYLIVVFTKRDQIECDSIDDYIEECPGELKQVLKIAGGGYNTINNRGDDEEKEADSKRLFDSTLRIMKQNEGDHFTSEMFKEAEALMKEIIQNELKMREQELRREIEEEMRKDMEEIVRKEREQFQKLLDETAEAIERMRLDLEAERAKVYGKQSERVLAEIVFDEMERNEKKDKLLQQIQNVEGERRKQMEQQLNDVNEEIKHIVKKRLEVEKEMTGERVTTAVVLKSRALREEERQKVEEEDDETMSRLQAGISNLSPHFLSLFRSHKTDPVHSP